MSSEDAYIGPPGSDPDDNPGNKTGAGGDGPASTSSGATILLVEDIANFFEELSGITGQLSVSFRKYAEALTK